MSAEKKQLETSSTHLPATSQNSTQTYFSDGDDNEIKLDEEAFQEESLQEEFPEEEEYLEEEMYLEEEKYLKGNEYGYEIVYLPERRHLEEKAADSYVYEQFLNEEGENLEEEKYLEGSGYLGKEEYLEDGEYLEEDLPKDACKEAHSVQTTPIFGARSPDSGSPKSSPFCQIPVSKTANQCPSLCLMFPKFCFNSSGTLLALTDRATQTEWTYESKSAILLKSKQKGEQEDSKVKLMDKMSGLEDYILAEVGKEEENVMESVSKTDYLEDLIEEPREALEVEDLDENFLNNTTYQTVFRAMLKEMAARSELEEDIDIPMTEHLESETRRKLGILLKKNFEKYKEAILWIMRKRETNRFAELGTFTFRLLYQKSPEIEEPEEGKIKKARHTVRRKKKVELDTEWMMKKTKVHQGDGKIILYPSGTLFQVLFPDGTGQIHYPSGNLAMLILSTNAKHFTYIILEDSEETWIRALINNSGHATFYNENRDIWLSLSHNLGYYFTEGGGQKAWNWWNLSLHIHSPPVQPISLTINRYINVQIRSQDNIFFYFVNKKKKIRLNLGTRYKYITPEALNEMKKKSIQEVEFGSTAQKIQILLGKMSKLLNLLTIPDLENFVESAMTFLVENFPKKTFQFQH
ncbi:glutamate-rich protein 6B [Elephas maximus indicus]|uniref:glutamate-rich protein 6B n=1 Tax=Elephas maximus indicus TaxID=99487 RepID=UPI00211694AF|nr:glutamate-rich protein 6B [Elephas maximus indicus]